MIRTIRKVIHGMLHEQVYYLDDEGLNTFFCEAENIVNSRPITKMNDTPDDISSPHSKSPFATSIMCDTAMWNIKQI